MKDIGTEIQIPDNTNLKFIGHLLGLDFPTTSVYEDELGQPVVKEWIDWKLTDESWKQWRKENSEEVKQLTLILNNK